MTFVVVGLALFVYGLIAGRVGPKLGTALALVPVLLYLVLPMTMQFKGALDSSESADLSAAILIGTLAFLTGSNLTERGSALNGGRCDASGAE